MERLVGLRREVAVDGDELVRARDLARDDDLVLLQPALERELGGLERREDHALGDDLLRRAPEVPVRVLLHLPHDELLVQGAAVHADAHGPPEVTRHGADRRELLVAPLPRPDVARVDPVLVERPRHLRVFRQEGVPVVVEVADERHVAARVEEPLLDLGHGPRGLVDVHRHAHELGARRRRARAPAATVPSTSAVSVFDMDWTTTGAPPPTRTFRPARRPVVPWRGIVRRGHQKLTFFRTSK